MSLEKLSISLMIVLLTNTCWTDGLSLAGACPTRVIYLPISVLEKSAALTYHIPILAEEGKRCAKAKLMIPLN